MFQTIAAASLQRYNTIIEPIDETTYYVAASYVETEYVTPND